VSGPNLEVLLKSSILKLESYLSLLINHFTSCFSLQRNQFFPAPRTMHFAIAILLAKLSVIGSVSDEIIKTNDDWILKRNLCSVMMKSETVSKLFSMVGMLFLPDVVVLHLKTESVEPLILRMIMLKTD
jgi:hypothetical protein